MFLLFLRFLPMIALAEVKMVIPQADPHNYDENQDYQAPKVEIPTPKAVEA
jgi:molybdopterin-containing oxidoreductase family membrane subunit